jgi:hypothetical protein
MKEKKRNIFTCTHGLRKEEKNLRYVVCVCERDRERQREREGGKQIMRSL